MVPGSSLWLLTFTLDPRGSEWVAFFDAFEAASGPRYRSRQEAETAASVRYVSRLAWNRLRTSLARELPGLAYFRALELQANGRAHLHVLVRTTSRVAWFADFAKLRRLATAAGFGPVQDYQLVRSAEVGRYVTKATAGAYVTKESARMPKWTRRATWSRSWCEWTPATGWRCLGVVRGGWRKRRRRRCWRR